MKTKCANSVLGLSIRCMGDRGKHEKGKSSMKMEITIFLQPGSTEGSTEPHGRVKLLSDFNVAVLLPYFIIAAPFFYLMFPL